MARVQAGDTILYSYTAMLENREMIETSSEEVAKENGLYDPERSYGPREATVGVGKLLKGLDDAVIGMAEGEEKEVVLLPALTYGDRDPNRIQRLSRSAFEKSRIVPKKGMRINMSEGRAWVTSVSEEEVEVDFNHPFAGRKLVFNIKVERVRKGAKE